VSTIDNSSQIHTLSCHSSSHSSSEVEEIFRSAPTTDYEEIYHENMHDHTAEMTANDEALVICDNANAIKNSEAFEISDDHVQHIDKCNRIEISDDDDDDKSFDDVPDNGYRGDEHENPTKIEINLTENRTDISQGNSLDLMFEDDSIIDDELRYLGL
jgi:ubiquitin